ncbi:MAG TPA: MaoC family dehydratase N-terminal domain-containing protein, partial [Gemmatimonadales bacterium]|nr:MaoC family dehydratase N-terminal domain-containing protein [Gemmatimonadales bacterium]
MSATILGARVGPLRQDLDARWLMAYAAGLGERDPRYYDTLAAGGPLAHPLFAVCYEWPAAVAMRDQTIPADLQLRSVHASHRLVIHRPPRAGDTLLTTARVTEVRARRAGTLVVTRFETVNAAGAEHAHRRAADPSSTSPLVPMSTARRSASPSSMRVASATATASAPTKPATSGSRHTRASG